MRKSYYATCVTCLLLISGACSQRETLTSSDQKAIADTIRQTLTRYHDDIRASGLRAEFRYLDNSAEFFWVPPGYSRAMSYEEVASVLNQSDRLYTSVDNSFDSLRITPLSRELATYTGRLRSTMTDTAGVVTVYTLVETGIMIKRDNGWKLFQGQTAVVE